MRSLLLSVFIWASVAHGQTGLFGAKREGFTTGLTAASGGTWAQDVAAATAFSASGTTPAISFSPTAGSFVIVGIVYRSDTSQPITSVTDNASGGSSTYQSAINSVNLGTHYTMAVFYCFNAKAGGSSITVTVPTSNPVSIIAKSYTGQKSSSDPKDQTSVVNTAASSSTQTSANITTTGAKDLVFGIAFQTTSSVQNFTATAPFTLLANRVDSSDGIMMACEDDLNVASSTSIGAAFTTAVNVNWWCAVTSFTN